MKVMLLLDSSGFGGIESHVLQLALMLHQRRVDVEVMFYRQYPQHPLYARLAQAGIRYRFAQGSVKRIRLAMAACTAEDTVHAHGYKASIVARLLRMGCACRVVTTFHAGETGDWKVRSYELLNRRTARLSENLAVSEAIRSRVGSRCRVMRNFIETASIGTRTALPERSRLRFAFVGRLSEEKGLDRYLQLSRLFPEHQWHVFGDGSQQQSLQAAPHCIYHGAVPSMQAYWAGIDVLIMPSRQEGLPMAAIEALAHGTLVIATQVGQLADLVDRRFLVPESQWQQMPVLIDMMAGWQPAMWRELQHQARLRVEQAFSADALWTQYRSIYRYQPDNACAAKAMTA